jgi:hypothetical protein
MQVLRVAGIAAASTLLFGGGSALLLATFGPTGFAPAPALAIKSLYGAVMGLVTTPPIARMALGLTFWSYDMRGAIGTAKS